MSNAHENAAAPKPVPFRSAPNFSYECSIHTMELHDDRGAPYSVVLDLIRTGKNPRWGIHENRIGLRAAVVDAGQRVVASRFTDAPAEAFPKTAGEMRLLDEAGRIEFRSVRGADGRMRDGDLDFDLSVIFYPSTVAQRAADWLKTTLERHLKESGESGTELLPIELLVEDYPQTEHTGSVWIKRPGCDEPVRLVADGAPTTVSHHYGNALTHYVFLTSVRRKGEPSFIAVIARVGLDLLSSREGPETRFPFGFLIRTDSAGHADVQPLHVDLDQKHTLEIGASLLGTSVDLQIGAKVGTCVLNGGTLPTWTGFGAATIRGSQLLSAFRLGKEERYGNVLIDVAGDFVAKAGLS